MNIMSKILGISAISIGITRMILNTDEWGYFHVFSHLSFYFHFGVFLLGIFAYWGGSKND